MKKRRLTQRRRKEREDLSRLSRPSLFTHGRPDDRCSSQRGCFLKLGDSFVTGFDLQLKSNEIGISDTGTVTWSYRVVY